MSAGHDERWDDTAAAFLLSALPADEATAFQAHLEACPACREELDRLRVAAEALPSSPPQLEPPPELKARIMAVVNAEAELLRAAGAQADRPAPPSHRARRFAWLPVRPALALAGAVAVLAVAAVIGIVASSGGPNTTTVAFTSSVAGLHARLIERPSGHSTIVTRGMPPAPRGRVYQVWLLDRGARRPTPTNALFEVRPNGTASVDVPGSLAHVAQVMVTDEPHGGSPQPTGRLWMQVSPA